MARSLTNAKEIKINGKAVKQIKDVAKDSVIWQSDANPVINDTFIGNGESLYFAPAAESVQRAIVRGTCSLSTDTATPETPATMSCNNGEMQYVDGVLTISGSPSTFDYNEARLNPVDLFGWGYADEQNILTGVITRKVQVSAMRGSWDWVQQSVSGATYFALPKATYPLLVCTHFHQVATATPANVGEWCEGSGDYLLFNYDGANDNLADFEDYLEDCYAANEAVICLTKRFVDVAENEQPMACVSVKGLNSFKYVANDDSNVCLKYRAVYPADNKIWCETTDGTIPYFWTQTLYSVQTINTTTGTKSNCTHIKVTPLTGNISEYEFDKPVMYAREYSFNDVKPKRIWMPRTFCAGAINANTWSGENIVNLYFGAGNSQTIKPYPPAETDLFVLMGLKYSSLYLRLSRGKNTEHYKFGEYTRATNGTNAIFIDMTAPENAGHNDYGFLIYNTMASHFVMLSTFRIEPFSFRVTAVPKGFVYVPQPLLQSYKDYRGSEEWAGTGYRKFAHKFFPIPECWI